MYGQQPGGYPPQRGYPPQAPQSMPPQQQGFAPQQGQQRPPQQFNGARGPPQMMNAPPGAGRGPPQPMMGGGAPQSMQSMPRGGPMGYAAAPSRGPMGMGAPGGRGPPASMPARGAPQQSFGAPRPPPSGQLPARGAPQQSFGAPRPPPSGQFPARGAPQQSFGAPRPPPSGQLQAPTGPRPGMAMAGGPPQQFGAPRPPPSGQMQAPQPPTAGFARMQVGPPPSQQQQMQQQQMQGGPPMMAPGSQQPRQAPMTGVPAAFQQQPAPGGMGMGPGQNGRANPNTGLPGLPDPVVASLDAEAQCPPCWAHFTFGQVPNSAALSAQSGLPLGAVVQPLAEHPDGEEVPVVNFGSTGVVRCKRCRAYINPFVQWIENGRRWRCNLCGCVNDTASQYYSHLEPSGKRADYYERPELSKGCVEIVAPAEYMVRPPQAPVYVFVIDVSYARQLLYARAR